MKRKILKFITTGFYSGLAPKAPGTCGSLAYLIIWLLLLQHSFYLELIAFLLVTIGGYLATATYLQFLRDKSSDPKNLHLDPSYVVIDEWAGMALPLFLANTAEPLIILLAFTLFRLLDIWKPWLIGKADNLPGAMGIMADDLLAGVLATILLLPFIALL